jgi:tetratricopeptide (TPR) repeat protein
MFPTDAGLCWRGRVHEQVGFCDGREPVPDALSWPLVRIRLHHHGYAPDVITRRGKLARNIRLLRLQLQDEPDDAVAMGFLGRELYLAGELDEAVAVLEQAEQRLAERPRYGRLSEVRAYLAEALLKLGRAEEAFGVTTRALAHQPGYPTSWFLRGQASLRMAVTHLAEARAAFQQAQAAARSYQGDLGFDPEVGGFKSLLALADVAKLEGRWDEAIRGYRAARPHVADPAPLDRQIAVMAEMAHRVVTLAGDRTSRHDEDGPGGAGASSGTGTATS